jgi:hypothetical protein
LILLPATLLRAQSAAPASGVNVPVVLCSEDPTAARARGLEPGLVQCVLQKPFDRSQLLGAISQARGS